MAVIIKIQNAQKMIPAMKRGIASAVNKVMRKAYTASSKKVREVYNIKARDLKSKTKFNRAHINKSTSSFSVSGGRLKLLYFQAKDNYPKGVTVKVKKTSGRKRLPDAFIERMPSGHVNVFRRKGKARLPLESLTTVGPVKMYEKEGEKVVEEVINRDLDNTIQHEIDFKLSRL